MRAFSCRYCLALVLVSIVSSQAYSSDAVVSTMRNVPAYMEYYGYSIKPIGTTITPGDPGPTQLFEITRPSNGSFTIGRLYTSCTCIQLSANQTSFGSGESAVLSVRNVLPTSGKTYPFYVQITSPIRATIRYDTYVISDSYTSSVTTQSTNVMHSTTSTTTDIEIIVPKYEPPVEEVAKDKEEKNVKDTSDEASESLSPVESTKDATSSTDSATGANNGGNKSDNASVENADQAD